MALGGVIKHSGWKLSRFTLCSHGCCRLLFFSFLLYGCCCKVKFIHERNLEANLLTCAEQTCLAWPWRCSQPWAEAPFSPSLCPCSFNSARCPDKAPQFHKWFICFSFKKMKKKRKEKCCCTVQNPNPGRNKIQPCHSPVASQISLH